MSHAHLPDSFRLRQPRFRFFFPLPACIHASCPSGWVWALPDKGSFVDRHLTPPPCKCQWAAGSSWLGLGWSGHVMVGQCNGYGYIRLSHKHSDTPTSTSILGFRGGYHEWPSVVEILDRVPCLKSISAASPWFSRVCQCPGDIDWGDVF